MKISVVGLGKLGACLMAVLATKHEVIGVDVNVETVTQINEGFPPVVEPGLGQLMRENWRRIRATTDIAEVRDTRATFIVVPSPSDPTGRFDSSYVVEAATGIGKAIAGRDGSHLVVVTSTVMPGTTLGPVAEALTAAAGLPLDERLGLCYSPEFIALGSVIHDMRNPDMILIGASSDGAHWDAEQILHGVAVHNPPVVRLTIPEAEIAKISINAYVTTKISFANTLAELCEHTPDADAVKVAAAVGQDSRIGLKYLRPASAWAGPCFPRDNQAFLAFAQQTNTPAPIAAATIAVNDRQVDRLANVVEAHTPADGTVGIFGLAYKPSTPVVDRSVGVELARVLVGRGLRVLVNDPMPMAMAATAEMLGSKVACSASTTAMLGMVNTAVFVQPNDEYRMLERFLDPVPVVVDVWGLFPDRRCLRPGIYAWGEPGALP